MLNRRQFLKGVALTATAAGAAGIASYSDSGRSTARTSAGEIAVRDRLYRLDGTSRVLVSQDQGASWAIHSNFGPRYAAERMKVDARGRLWIAVRHDSQRFSLELSDDSSGWRSA
jgi:hypothetical protein